MNCSMGESIDPRWLDERRGEGWSSGERTALWEGKALSQIEYAREPEERIAFIVLFALIYLKKRRGCYRANRSRINAVNLTSAPRCNSEHLSNSVNASIPTR